jgi:mono/diheme cytochrome c family protein
VESGQHWREREGMRPISLTCVVAAMVMVMFVGCQKESPYKSSSSSLESVGESVGDSAGESTGGSAGVGNGGGHVDEQVGGDVAGPATPAELSTGEALFKADCAACHGQEAMGTDHGPPLVHPIYQPDHHSDASFYLAIRNGARSHHWMFGNMPPVQGVTDEDATRIVAYIRWLQHTAGIF